MDTPQPFDFVEFAQQQLARQKPTATHLLEKLVRGEFQRPPESQLQKLVFEYLPGLDHAILAYVFDQNERALTENHTIFAGFHDKILELEALDHSSGTNYAALLRSNEKVAELIYDWFVECFQNAAGQGCAWPCLFRYEGDSALFNLQTQEWEEV